MKLQSITPTLTQYIFPPDSEEMVAQDIRLTVLVADQQALIIDSGYPPHGRALRQALDAHGIQPHTLILSHYHPDHAGGAAAFEDCRVLASPHYRRSYEFYQQIYPGQRFLEPTDIVQDGDTFTFGEHHIQLLATPGHSPCSLTTILNGTTCHIGDMLAYAGDRFSIPYLASGGDFQTYIQSLQRVQQLKPQLLITAHGTAREGEANIQHELQRGIHYLQRMLDTNAQAPLEELVLGDLSGYTSFVLHEKNVKRLKKLNNMP